MMLTLPATRLLIPARPAPERLLERGRLLNLLNGRRRKLMLLVAPAGFGKTTLALDYLATSNLWQVGEAAAWLSLDLGGIVKWDTRIFVQALSLALKNALPSLDLAEVERELAQLPAGSELSEEIAANLIFSISNTLARQPRPVLLTIDDYHLVCDERTVRDARLINDIVNALLVTSPGQLRIMISSRVYPTLDVLKLSMDDELVVINKNHLKFTKSEIAAFLSLRGKDALLADQIVQESEGWAAAVSLKLQNLDIEAHLKDHDYSNALVSSSRYNVLAEEMLKQLERPLRRLLEACSVLDFGINARVASRLISCYEAIEAPVSDEVIEAQLSKLESCGLVERHNSLTLAESDGGGEPALLYRLHNLLKEYLEKTLDQQANQALNNAACLYYRDIGDWMLAFEHALKSLNHPLAAEILEERAYKQFKSSDISEIEQRVGRLEEVTLEKHPHLLLVAGIAGYNAGQIDKSLAYFHAANRRWGRYDPLDQLIYHDELEINMILPGHTPVLAMELFRLLNKAETIIGIIKLWEVTGRVPRAIVALEGIKDLLSPPSELEEQGEERRIYVLALACRHLGNCYRLASRYNESIEELTRAINMFLRLEDGYNVAACRQNLGIAWRQVGNQARAEENYNQARAYWERQGNLKQLCVTLNSLAVSLINSGRYQEAVELLLEALEKAREAGNEAITPYLLVALADAYLGLHDKAKALSYYAQAGAEASRQNRFEIMTYAKLGAARVLRRASEPSQARQAILAALDYAEESTPRDLAAVTVENGAYQLLFSQLELAQAQLEGGLSLAHKVQDRETEALAHFWLAYLHFRQDRYKTASDNMRKAITLAQQLGYDAFLHEEARELADFADHFRHNPNDPVGAFFARGAGYATSAESKVELQAFGKGRILRGGQEVASVSRKARELIFLLLEQGVPVSGERISEALWPEGQLAGNGLGSGFYSTITHARRALGNSEAIRAADGAYSLNLRYRYDVEQFEEQLSRAERLSEPAEKIACLQIALEMANSEFLADTDSEWVRLRRQELWDKKLRAWQLCQQAYQAQGDQEKALAVLAQLMAAEPFDEQYLRGYVELLVELKSKTVALNFLRRKMEELSREGIEPEDITVQLYEQLDSSRSIARRRKS